MDSETLPTDLESWKAAGKPFAGAALKLNLRQASRMGKFRAPWVAKITGLHTQFGFKREFVEAKTKASGSTWTFSLTGGLYEICNRKSKGGEVRRFIFVQNGEKRGVPADVVEKLFSPAEAEEPPEKGADSSNAVDTEKIIVAPRNPFWKDRTLYFSIALGNRELECEWWPGLFNEDTIKVHCDALDGDKFENLDGPQNDLLLQVRFNLATWDASPNSGVGRSPFYVESQADPPLLHVPSENDNHFWRVQPEVCAAVIAALRAALYETWGQWSPSAILKLAEARKHLVDLAAIRAAYQIYLADDNARWMNDTDMLPAFNVLKNSAELRNYTNTAELESNALLGEVQQYVLPHEPTSHTSVPFGWYGKSVGDEIRQWGFQWRVVHAGEAYNEPPLREDRKNWWKSERRQSLEVKRLHRRIVPHRRPHGSQRKGD